MIFSYLLLFYNILYTYYTYIHNISAAVDRKMDSSLRKQHARSLRDAVVGVTL